jgi:hypothetical protein
MNVWYGVIRDKAAIAPYDLYFPEDQWQKLESIVNMNLAFDPPACHTAGQ